MTVGQFPSHARELLVMNRIPLIIHLVMLVRGRSSRKTFVVLSHEFWLLNVSTPLSVPKHIFQRSMANPWVRIKGVVPVPLAA